ncbi:hypothetical protein ACJX0J_036465, partial [Zea mays]
IFSELLWFYRLLGKYLTMNISLFLLDILAIPTCCPFHFSPTFFETEIEATILNILLNNMNNESFWLRKSSACGINSKTLPYFMHIPGLVMIVVEACHIYDRMFYKLVLLLCVWSLYEKLHFIITENSYLILS